MDAGDLREATRLLRRCVNALSAFAEIQAHFDPLDIGRPTIGTSRKIGD